MRCRRRAIAERGARVSRNDRIGSHRGRDANIAIRRSSAEAAREIGLSKILGARDLHGLRWCDGAQGGEANDEAATTNAGRRPMRLSVMATCERVIAASSLAGSP